MAATAQWGPLRSLLTIFPVLLGSMLLALKHHYNLPTPIHDLHDPLTNLPQISETRILSYAQHLSEDIGYRTVGTYEHALADEWMWQQANRMKELCEQVVREEGHRKLECEVWRQQGSGSHRFDMMAKRLYKTYVNLTNIVVRVSDGTPEGKEHAVLVNSHLDSTLPSPGAADDALSVGVMLECIRVLVSSPGWSPKHAIVFLFNNAEESLQDGSHLYSTQHSTAPTVRAAINLEAAGSTGREMLFQATSEEMIQAYSHVPRPFGTILANDIFSSGVLLSDTDFRQFEEYLNVAGLDMAVVGNSYLYHMRKDLVENIQAGVAQHMGENALALLQHLSSPDSPLPSLTSGYTAPSTVFISHTGFFFSWSFATAKVLYVSFFLVLIYTVPSSSKAKSGGLVPGIISLVYAGIGAVVVPNIVAAIMQYGLGKGMSWFSREFSTVVLFGPPAFLGAVASQLLLAPVDEHDALAAVLLTQSFLAVVIQMLNVGSAVMLFMSALPLYLTLLLNRLITGQRRGEISLWTYSLGQFLPLLSNVQAMAPTLEVFVPLTGRLGGHVPADNVIATLVSVMGAQLVPLALPFFHRFGRPFLVRATGLFFTVTVVTMAVFAMRKPFDEMHQKRIFVLHLENITSQEQHLHIATADGAPGFDLLANSIAGLFTGKEEALSLEAMHDHNPNWDPLFPFSAFLTPYKVDLVVDPTYVSPWASGNTFTVSAINDVTDFAQGTRSFTLRIYHPGVIWTVIAFDAHVLKWTLDDNPPDEFARHHVKEASFYGIDTWSVDMVIKLPDSSSSSSPPSGALKVDFNGILEKGMWPGKKSVKEQGGAAMKVFERLDGWLDQETGGTVDATLLGCVAGVIVV
ncbi:hypothetical protein PC9H_006946 [Pleurotus ostreatus]|uniref:Peptide hydrolase n=1 Tax=Pleurotus ostreatus TaxID=5322 RepID=A0A8H6ZX63_PLEOS|nr:uncharacterized protein PC9H_006946 [Pleurotus ostreatus]KAF7431225.1 hypothetical protein PC9H_006946 [Pleurotus ostreatus]KAJ8695691.1 hypothetical protein PTI98_008264 [Pleurotus ostreatus]